MAKKILVPAQPVIDLHEALGGASWRLAKDLGVSQSSVSAYLKTGEAPRSIVYLALALLRERRRASEGDEHEAKRLIILQVPVRHEGLVKTILDGLAHTTDRAIKYRSFTD